MRILSKGALCARLSNRPIALYTQIAARLQTFSGRAVPGLPPCARVAPGRSAFLMLNGTGEVFRPKPISAIRVTTSKDSNDSNKLWPKCLDPKRFPHIITYRQWPRLSFPATLDDLMNVVIEEILSHGIEIAPTEGPAIEISGVLLQLTNPRARLSRTETRGKPYSCLGELCWYLAKSDDLGFIEYYLPRYEKRADGRKLPGAYGPRLFESDGTKQVDEIVDTLKKKRCSRQAVIQLFDAHDLVTRQKDVPCTCTLQFMIRSDQLILIVYMRSNDAFLGLPHDIFCFTMLQEIVAHALEVEVGVYKHALGSLHLYQSDVESAKEFLTEGFQSTKPIMPAMPLGDPWPNVAALLAAEDDLRNNRAYDSGSVELPPTGATLSACFKFFAAKKNRDVAAIKALRREMSSDTYLPFIDKMLN